MSVPTSKHAKRIAEVKSATEAVPPGVETAYIPSGKFEALSIPLLIVGSIVGWVLGSLIAAVAVAVTGFALYGIGMTGKCHPLIFLFLLAVFFIAPIAIPITQGVYIGKATKWGRCRSVGVTQVMSNILGLLTAGVMVFFVGPALTLIGEAFDISMESCSFLHPTMLDEPVKLYIYGGIMGLLSLLIAVSMSTAAVKEHKFCEKCLEYLKDTVVARFPIKQVKPVLLTLLERSLEYKSALQKLSQKSEWKAGDERVDVAHATCTCEKTNFLECKAYWSEVTQSDKGESTTNHNRLVYAARMTPEEVTAATDLLLNPAPTDVPATTP